jgi:hypothetical protein
MMAELCEQVYAVWQQIFYAYWAREIDPLQSGAPSQLTNTPFQVMYCSQTSVNMRKRSGDKCQI